MVALELTTEDQRDEAISSSLRNLRVTELQFKVSSTLLPIAYKKISFTVYHQGGIKNDSSMLMDILLKCLYITLPSQLGHSEQLTSLGLLIQVLWWFRRIQSSIQH